MEWFNSFIAYMNEPVAIPVIIYYPAIFFVKWMVIDVIAEIMVARGKQ